MTIVNKVISGGQIGADQFGLEVAKILGLETGGTAPQGFVTSEGKQKAKLESYGLAEGEPDSRIYPKRTIKNVRDSDGTVLFGNEKSPGSRLTKNTTLKLNKPYIANPTVKELSKWLLGNNIKTLNVAGNRNIPAILVKPILMEALKKS